MCNTVIVLLAILAQHSSPTSDPQAKAQAQRLLTEGSGLYDKGDYADALEKFNAAYAAYPSPKLMFNIGQANRDLGRPVEALRAYERFLAGALDASPETTADARKSLAELRGKLGRIRIDCATTDAELSVDGSSVGLAPLPDPIWATPGRHQVTASHQRVALAIENVYVTAGSLHTVTLDLRPPATAAAPGSPAAVAVVAESPGVAATPAVEETPAVAATPTAEETPAVAVMPAVAEISLVAALPPANPTANLTSSPETPEPTGQAQPVYRKWWVWTGIGGVVAAGSVTAFLLTRRSSNPCGGIGYACLEIK